MRIDTKLKLIAYVRTMLGSPQIECEVSDAQISQIIDDTIQKFTEFAYGTLEATICVNINGKGTYHMPENVTNIIKISKGSTGNISNFASNYGVNYVPDLWSQQFFTSSITGSLMSSLVVVSNARASIEHFFGDDIYFNWNHYKKILQIFDSYKGPALIHFYYEYQPDEVDQIYNHEWIKRYAIAKTKVLWGQITGKYDADLVGGVKINYDNFKSEGNDEIEKLEEELIDKWSDPCPLDVA